MIYINTNKLLIITWVAMAFLIGGGVGYLLGVQGVGQKVQQNFGPGPQGQGQQQGGNIQQPVNQGETLNQNGTGQAPAGAPGGRNPAPNQNGSGLAPNGGGQQPVNQFQR